MKATLQVYFSNLYEVKPLKINHHHHSEGFQQGSCAVFWVIYIIWRRKSIFSSKKCIKNGDFFKLKN